MTHPKRCATRLLIVALLALLPACERRPTAPGTVEAPPASTVDYACLIIKDLSGKDDVIVSPGFPAYRPLDEMSGDDAATPAAERVKEPLLGTRVRVAVYDMERDQAQTAVDAALTRIVELSARMNIFKSDSALSRINRDAARTPQTLDDDLYRVIRLSLETSRFTEGAFDVTVGPLTDLWRKARKAGKLPDESAVRVAMERVGYQFIELDEKNHTIRFKREGMSIDLGGIAKGFVAEEAAKVLLTHGVRSAVIDCGGDLRLIGSRPGDKPFRVGVEDPRKALKTGLRFIVELRNQGVVTSGNYRQFSIIRGKRRSHLVDPRTGQSVEAFPSVTVTGPDAGICDALATALGIVDEPTALAIIQRANNQPKH